MNEELRALLKAYRELPRQTQKALELLSVVYRPISRKETLELVNGAGIRKGPGTKFTYADMRKLVDRLMTRRLVTKKGQRFQCNTDIAEAITREAGRAGRLKEWVEITDVLLPGRRARRRATYPYHRSWQEFLEVIRISVHLNEPEEFQRHAGIWRSAYDLAGACPDPFDRIFNRPFDAAWLDSRDPVIRDAGSARIVENALQSLAPCREQADFLRQHPHDRGNYLVAEHDILAGNGGATSMDLPDDSAWGQVLRGWARCIEGQWQQAIAHFEGAVKIHRKARGIRRAVVLPPRFQALRVIALLGTGEIRHARAAGKLADEARDAVSNVAPLYRALKGATLLLADGPEAARECVASVMPETITDPLLQVFACTALCWVDRDRVRKHRQALAELGRRAEGDGYAWVAAECRRILERADPEGRPPTGASQPTEGYRALVDAVRDQAPWERKLAALEGLTLGGKKQAGAAAASRLTWRILPHGETATIEPYEQKLNKKGLWTKGRSVSLRRLHDRSDVGCLSAQDFRICAAVEAAYWSGRADYAMSIDKAMPALVGHPLVFRADNPETRVEVIEAEPQLQVTAEGDQVRMRLVPEPVEDHRVRVTVQSRTRVAVTVFGPEHNELFSVLGADGMDVPAGSEDRVERAVAAVSGVVTVHSDVGGGTDAVEVAADPTPLIHLTPYGNGLRVEPFAAPLGTDGPLLAPGEGGSSVISVTGGQRTRAARDLPEEKRRIDSAVASCPTLRRSSRDEAGWTLPEPDQCLELLEELHALGDRVRVGWPGGEKLSIRHRVTADNLYLKIRQGRDWFRIDGEVRLDSGLVMTLRELLDRAEKAKSRFIEVGKDQFVALSGHFLKRVSELGAYAERHGKGLRFHPSRTLALEPLVEDAGAVDADEHWAKRLERFRRAQAHQPEVPSTLQAELRDYQVEGFQWAARLAEWGAGACLADDMGLGKTIQALAVALSRAPDGPTLVVAPTSVCANWIEETRRFAPTLNAIQFGQGDREKTLEGLKPFDLLVCSYGLLHTETEGLAAISWETVVLDEAQAIKNRETLRSRAAMRLAGGFRMITTGTPIENHLGELWNLFHFINPGLLGSAKSFVQKFAMPIHQQGSHEARGALKRLIQPFILRRTKAAVLEELPARTEITVRVEMGAAERALYHAVRERAMLELHSTAGEGGGAAHLRILKAITRLRLACCHPSLAIPDTELAGAKLEAFMETAAELIDNGHKALVFSQFTTHLAIVRSRLDDEGIRYHYLDGSTPPKARKREVDAFQAGDGDLFLISLRAGGQGLNLTAADYVVHLDPWWNPAVEDQASDRAHRIGQTRPVTIYRLVMKDTIEEKIIELHSTKRDLADDLLEGADMSGKMSAEELLALIREA